MSDRIRLTAGDLRRHMWQMRHLHDGDEVIVNIYDPATCDNKGYYLSSVTHDPRDESVGIFGGALYLNGEVTDPVEDM